MTDQNNITGRDGYIIAKALTWAMEYAKTRPEDEREYSDESDMCGLFEKRFGALASLYEHGGDDGVEFIEDGSTPTPEPDFISEKEDANPSGLETSRKA